jgi:hypothetical protein
MNRRGWLGLLAGCLLALFLIPAGWALTRPDASGIGQLPVVTGPTGSPTANPPASVTDLGTGASAIPVYQADLAAQRGADVRTPTPTTLTIASIAVSAPVEAAGVAPDGTVAIPHNAYHVGWYEFGPAPGAAAGSAVIVGHRDSRTQGRGALYNLGAVNLGDQVQVRLSDGKTLAYRVVERRLYLKQGLPWATFFTNQGSPRLTVITCGGAYDPNHGGYQDNLIVTATPT